MGQTQPTTPPPTRTRARLIAATAALLGALLVLAGCGTGSSGVTRPSGLATDGVTGNAVNLYAPNGRKHAPTAEGPELAGDGTVSTANHPGKVVVINVWASWCAPCRKEAPGLAAASSTTEGKAQFVGLNIRDQLAAAQAFERTFKIPYPSIQDPDAAQLMKFSGVMAVNAIPTTLVVDARGGLAAQITGPVDEKTLVQIITDVAEAR